MSDSHDKSGEDGHSKSGGSHGGGGHGPGGGSHEEAHEGAPEWLISFADNVALLMGFFVILLAMNMAKPKTGGLGGENKNPNTDSAEMLDWVIMFRESFNNPIDINSTDPAEAALVRRQKERLRDGDTLQPGPDGDKHDVQAPRTTDFVNITCLILFPEGESSLSQDAVASIAQTAESLRGTQWIIEVRGHASTVETARNKVQSMKLAFDRAFAIAQELVRAGVPWDRLRVAACADNERATPTPRDAAGNGSNQRGEIVVTTEPVAADPYSAGSSKD